MHCRTLSINVFENSWLSAVKIKQPNTGKLNMHALKLEGTAQMGVCLYHPLYSQSSMTRWQLFGNQFVRCHA